MSIKLLNELLLQNESEREVHLVSLEEWQDNIPFVVTEEEVKEIFLNTYRALYEFLGEPVYFGEGEKYGTDIPSPNRYFDSTISAIHITWWNAYNGEVALFHTGHDADSLQFVTLAISDTCNLATPNKTN